MLELQKTLIKIIHMAKALVRHSGIFDRTKTHSARHFKIYMSKKMYLPTKEAFSLEVMVNWGSICISFLKPKYIMYI